MENDRYREIVYRGYASHFQDSGPVFRSPEARKWGRAYDYYLRGWLPKEKSLSIADIGCGGGRFLFFLSERGYSNVVGVDKSPEQIMLAKQVNSNVRNEDAVAFLERSPGAFDLIVALDLMEHLKKDELFRFLQATHGALLIGGRLVLQTPNAASPFFGGMRYGDISHEICVEANSITRLLCLHGFRNVVIRETAPVPWGYSLPSSVRHLGWQVIKSMLGTWNLIETGFFGTGIFTRNLIASAVKRNFC